MKDFKRPSGQGANKGGFGKRPGNFGERAGYGSHKGDFNSGDRREVKHKAVCSDCGNSCEVPFRPNGSKPVYCKDCFGSKKGAHGGNYEKPEFKHAAHPAREERPQAAPSQDRRVDELKAQMDSMQSKLDRILSALESAPAPAAKREEKPVSKPVAKKAAPKAAPKKPVAKKKK